MPSSPDAARGPDQAPAATTSTTTITDQDDPGRQPPAAPSAAAELARVKISLHGALARYPDFPIPGISFIDIMPLFLNPATHADLLRCLELQVRAMVGPSGRLPDVLVGLEARGFLFGPSLALRLGAAFVPVRKKGKLPGPCVTASYQKEYGADEFQMQRGAIRPEQTVLVVDDIIATGEPCSVSLRAKPPNRMLTRASRRYCRGGRRAGQAAWGQAGGISFLP
jgi:adenine phosphoribosyltransferase